MGLTSIRLLLLGYSGKANFGDDLLLKQAVDALAMEKDISISIHTAENSGNSDYLAKWFPAASILKGPLTFSIIRSHTHVVYFGGGVFFEYKQLSLSVFLRRLISQILLFTIPKLFFGVKFFGIGMGLGPFHSQRGFWLTGHRLRHFSYLGLRDEDSRKMAEDMACSHLHVSPDLSLLECLKYQALPREHQNSDKRKILVCARHYPHTGHGNQYLQSLRSALTSLKEAYPAAEISVFGFQKNHDEAAVESLLDLGIPGKIWDPMQMQVGEVLQLFASQDLIISSRMHGIFMAGIAGVPSLAIGVHPKLQYASAFFPESRAVDESSDAQALFQAMVSALETKTVQDGARLRGLGEQCRMEYEKLIANLKQG